jgi:hypothetical protein
MRLPLIGLLILLSANLTAQTTEFNPNQKFHPDSLIRWTKTSLNEISKKHPGFYRYTSREKFSFLIDSTTQTIQDSLSTLEYYRKLKPLFARIGCLHTGILLPKAYNRSLEDSSMVIPLEVFIDEEKKVFVTKNYSANPDIPLSGEIISINGKSIQSILHTLIDAIPADGYNQTEKILLLNHRFAFWYQSMIQIGEDFNVDIRSNGQSKQYATKGVSSQVFPSAEAIESRDKKALAFEIVGNTGMLTIHSFAKTAIKKSGQHYAQFLKTTFKTLKDRKIKNLVVNLRYNSGGTDGNAALLAAYFFNQPFRYWDRIEITAAIAQEIKGIYRFFYGKPEKKDTCYLWKKNWVTHEFDYYQPQKPAKNNYQGNTYLLANGLCMSSCSDVIAILSHNKKALVIGQETGGGYQGNTSGMIPKAKIATGLFINIPLQKYTNAVDPHKNVGHGTIPDFPVIYSLKDWLEKKDMELEQAMRLINGN